MKNILRNIKENINRAETIRQKKRIGVYFIMAILIPIMAIQPIMAQPFQGQARYQQTNLVSDISGLAKITDPNLTNPWGISHSPTSPWWVSDNGKGVATIYNGTGIPRSLIVTIPPPTGQTGPSTPDGNVFNGGTDFEIAPGEPAIFIFVTEDGTISGWNPNVDQTNAILKVNNSATAVYKGVTIAKNGNDNLLYVANFREAKVDVFDTNFNKVNLGSGAFTDNQIPTGFAPFNVQNIKGNVFVSFAKQDAQKHDDVAGAGLGFVDEFKPSGELIMRLSHGPWLNAPWAIVRAPLNFGAFSNAILVGNFGSGMISSFDTLNGNFKGFLIGTNGPVVIDGLWGLGFGNGANAGPVNTLFFAAGINDEQHGLFGTLTPER
jgi:uncharacterized protein (TIGR03118 family)